jgi:hypothetical protein
MFHRLRKSSRGVSEVLASVLIISLVVGASALVGSILLNVDVVDLFGYLDTPQEKDVAISLNILIINDTDLDTLSDTMIFYLSLDAESPSIYIQDFDILLPTGQVLDDLNPWLISGTSQPWNDEYFGFTLQYGFINASFTIQVENLNLDEGEISSGTSFHIVIDYSYTSELGGRLRKISTFYQNPLIIAP